MIDTESETMNTLKEWANDVIETITPLAIESKLTFYPLQSPAKKNPKYLLLGLNPAKRFTYIDQSNKDSIWKFVDGKMTVDQLLNGNPDYVNKDRWTIIRGLRKIPMFNEVIDGDDYVFMNYFYANTDAFADALKSELRNFQTLSKQLTYRFIEIVQPEVIIVLGTANGLNKLDKFDGEEQILQGVSQRLLIKAKYKDIPVYAIPHPSRLILSSIEKEALNTNLKELIAGKPLTTFNIPSSRPATKFPLLNLAVELKNGIVLHFQESKKDAYGCEFPGIDSEKLVLRISNNKGEKCWSVRSAEKDVDYINHLKYLDIYQNTITNVTDKGKQAWIFRKGFDKYNAISTEELKEMVVADIQLLYDTIKGFKP